METNLTMFHWKSPSRLLSRTRLIAFVFHSGHSSNVSTNKLMLSLHISTESWNARFTCGNLLVLKKATLSLWSIALKAHSTVLILLHVSSTVHLLDICENYNFVLASTIPIFGFSNPLSVKSMSQSMWTISIFPPHETDGDCLIDC